MTVGRAVVPENVEEHKVEALLLLEQLQLEPALLAVGEALGAERDGAAVAAGEGLDDLDVEIRPDDEDVGAFDPDATRLTLQTLHECRVKTFRLAR